VIRIVIQQLAIFVVPLALYTLYFLVMRKRAQRAGATPPRWEEGPWFWLIFAGIALSVAAFFVFGLLKGGNPDVLFVPPSGPQ
jgi:Family of unknown function (DUF6111)